MERRARPAHTAFGPGKRITGASVLGIEIASASPAAVLNSMMRARPKNGCGWRAQQPTEDLKAPANVRGKVTPPLAPMSKADPKSPDNDLDLPTSSSGRSEVDLDQPL